ncbi:MAG: MBL fold metallo-hydrolase, partial [Caulobacteraceae bacterium]
MIPFVREIDVDYGQVTRVSPLIRRVIADNPGPFTYTGTGTYLVGSGEVAIIDPGPDLPNHLAAILAALGPDRLTDILVTHHHLDHSPLARPLAAVTGATIRGLAAPARADDGRAGLEAGNDRFAPDVPVKTGDRFSGPGWTLEALHTPGHTSNHVCYALVEENALFSGDHVMGWSTTVVTPPDGDMGDYMASLRAVAARDFATLWPTHGPPVTDVAPFLAAYSEHRRERERQILRRLAAGDETIAAMVPTIYASVDPRLHAAAAHSMLAHMIELVKTGAVT